MQALAGVGLRPIAPAPARSRRASARRARPTRHLRVTSADGAEGSPRPDEPNATWDEQSGSTGLSAQLRTTNALRERLSRALFDVDPSLVDPEVVYKSQVHEARGAPAYNALMRAWKPGVKRQLSDFTYDVERAFSPEPGVLLVRWRAEWDGAFNADAAMLEFVETNFPDYDAAELEKIRRDVDGPDRVYTGEREYNVRGITTVRVNQLGKVTMHEDRVVEKGEYSDVGLSSVDEGADEIGGSGDARRKAGGAEGAGAFGGGEEEDEDAKQARDEFATTVFYNALRPPGEGSVKWFFDVLLELEWQYFRRQVGDDTTMIQNKEEFVNTIATLLVTVVVLPTAIISFAIVSSLTNGGALGGGDEYDALIQQADAADKLAATRANPPTLDVDLLKSIYGAKIGA